MKELLQRKVSLYWLLLVLLAALLVLAAVWIAQPTASTPPSVNLSASVMATDPVNGLTQEQLHSLESASIPWAELVAMTKEQALIRLEEVKAAYTENYDLSLRERFDGNFAELAQAGEGAYYDWKSNRLVGAQQIEAFITAVEKGETGGFLYFADSAYEPFICDFFANAGDDFFTMTLYRPDGSKETLESRDTYQGNSYYRFGNDVAAPSLPIYIPFGEDDPAQQKVLEEYYNLYVVDALDSGLLIDSWNSPATINPERLMNYYLRHYLLPRQSISDADTVEIEGAKLEGDILGNFDMPVRRIRAADNYNEANQTYRFTGGIGSVGGGQVTNYTREGDILTLECNYFSMADMTTIQSQGRIKLQLQGDSHKYLANARWDLE